ncbi:MAG: type 1 glutamine amidotransferase [Deltaproteobacteria bacterium]|nr:type 1 glutamine amidotransferase [Deltaproteobacteria bacterium]
MQNPWIIFQHVREEGPALIEEILKERKEPCRIIHSYRGDKVPEKIDGARGLIVMGGPMNVDETDRFPFLRAERELMAQAVSQKVPVLGVCLGAQMLARALEARVWKGTQLELGFDSVELTPQGAQDPLFEGLGDKVPVFQWHHDTFDLPKEAVRLASSSVYPNQAFRAGSRAYGFQFHLEITPGLLRDWARWLKSQNDTHAPLAQHWIASEQRFEVHRVGRTVLERFFSL